MLTFKEMHDARFALVVDQKLTGEALLSALRLLTPIPVLAIDNHGHQYPVCLESTPRGLVLYCVGAPSGWSLPDLLDREYSGCGLAFDYGQGWFWMNPANVLASIPAYLLG
jgi:hypothetical protein